MAPQSTVLNPREHEHRTLPSRLDWPTLGDAFELACLVRCGSPASPGARSYRPPEAGRGGVIEFNQELAAERMRQLLSRLGVPAVHEVTTGGLRRRFHLHRVHVPRTDRATYAALLETGWWQGRREVLAPPVPATPLRRVWRPRLAAAAWRSALLAGGRHVRKHILGVRLNDRDLAAVLVRGAALLDVSVSLVPGAGCVVVSVPNGPDRDRILDRAGVPALAGSVA